MTEAYQCDRCGSFVSGEPFTILKTINNTDETSTISSPHVTGRDRDLCRECSGDFRDFMGGFK